MADQPVSGDPGDVHVAGWTVVRAAGPFDEAGVQQLLRRVQPLLGEGAQVVLDVRDVGDEPEALRSAATGLAATARERGTRLVLVLADGPARDRLRAAGVQEVSESLDAALGVTAPVLREAEARTRPGYPRPTAADPFVVAAEDALPGENRSS